MNKKQFISADLKGYFMKIKILVMDVDGTLTDGKVYIGNTGEVFKVFNIKDGYGINNILPISGIEPIIITGRKSKMLQIRCDEIGITEIYQNVSEKLVKLKKVIKNKNLILENVAYIGDDLNDLECMNEIHKSGGITSCPADAIDAVKKSVDYICSSNGGEGAVREFIDWLRER